MRAGLRIGISGWRYAGWRGAFYPEGLPQRRELEYASRLFNSLEINGSFYSLQTPKSWCTWYERTPRDFVFAVKGGRYITHILRLREARTALANFFASGVLRLDEKLGPILWQLPPRMAFEPEHVKRFCEMLPKDTDEAAALACEHDDKVAGKASFEVAGRHRLRHAFEPRDERFMTDEFVRILRANGHALVFADTAGKFPAAYDLTAGFVYVRLHGASELYASRYRDDELDWWKRRLAKWSTGEEMATDPKIAGLKAPARKRRDAYVYFDNDMKVHAPFDALRLAKRLEAGWDPTRMAGRDGERLPPPPRLQDGEED